MRRHDRRRWRPSIPPKSVRARPFGRARLRRRRAGGSSRGPGSPAPAASSRSTPQPLKRKTATQLGREPTSSIRRPATPSSRWKALTGGRGVDYAFEVIGLPETIVTTYQLARPRAAEVIVVGMARLRRASSRCRPSTSSTARRRSRAASTARRRCAATFPRFRRADRDRAPRHFHPWSRRPSSSTA